MKVVLNQLSLWTVAVLSFFLVHYNHINNALSVTSFAINSL